MGTKPILLVDDEKNIRLTVKQALEKLNIPIETAVNGEDALQKLSKTNYSLVLLDIKMPGMDGMEVLRELRNKRNTVKVLIITAHGTVDNAVEALKLGAVDFIQKPFSPTEIREFTEKALKRKSEALTKTKPDTEKKDYDYDDCVEQAKAAIEDNKLAAAIEWAKEAVSIDTSRPEAYNFLGVLNEMNNDRLQAQKYYRAALSIEATYGPAQHNLEISTGTERRTSFDLGDEEAKDDQKTRKGFILGSLFKRSKKQ